MNFIDNLTIARKLLLAFGVLLTLLLSVGVTSILSSRAIEGQTAMVKDHRYRIAMEIMDLVHLAQNVQEKIRAAAESEMLQTFHSAKEEKAQFEEKMLAMKGDSFLATETGEALEVLHRKFQAAFEAGEKMVRLAVDQEFLALVPVREEYRKLASEFTETAGELKDQASANLYSSLEEINSQAESSGRLAGAVSVAALIAGLLLAVVIGRNISRPLRRTAEMIQELEKGHLDHRLRMRRRDEIGRMAEAMDAFADSLQQEVVGAMQRLALGDLTFEAAPRDERDVIRGALQKLGQDLNVLMTRVRTAGEQIAMGSAQVSDSSQSLSQGATEQAEALEEISSSMSEMGDQVLKSAENAAEAERLAARTREAANEGNVQMQTMTRAMAELNDSGKNVSRIIKTIDEIAFQTNLLALNAAVEAARAGKYGRGFAVVAEEVRNLAARSARAAKETEELIEESVRKAENGSRIAQGTAGALGSIIDGINKLADFVAEIATASDEQAQGIAQISQGLSQIDLVTQQTTSHSQESAAAAEELSGQAADLREMLESFRLRTPKEEAPAPSSSEKIERTRSPGSDRVDHVEAPLKPERIIALDDREFGRY